jgi:hypothetical protein
MKTTNLPTLKIHKLSQAQYERELAAGRIDENAIYLTPDENNDVDPSGYASITDVDEKVDSHNTSTSAHNDIRLALNEINTEVELLKTSVSEGKALIASAVTDKGVQTAGDATFATIAANIRAISTGESGGSEAGVDLCEITFWNDTGNSIEFQLTSNAGDNLTRASTGTISGITSTTAIAVCGSVAVLKYVRGYKKLNNYDLCIGDTWETITNEQYHVFQIPYAESIDITYGM